MVRWDKNTRIINNATIVLEKNSKVEIHLRKEYLEELYNAIIKMAEDGDNDANLLRGCLEGGRKIVLKKGNIYLYFCVDQAIQRTKCEIYNNNQLYELLEKFAKISLEKSHS